MFELKQESKSIGEEEINCIAKENRRSCCCRLFDDEQLPDSPRKVLFAQLLPKRATKAKNGHVQSILAPKLNLHYSPGAKRIDVISRIMFPAIFASLNVIYWSYYLTKAGGNGELYEDL